MKARNIILGCISILVLLSIVSTCSAADTIGIVCCSYHQDRDKEYNEQNYGLVYQHTFDNKLFVAGTFKNSLDKQAAFAGIGPYWQLSSEVTLSLPVGLTTGYKDSVSPFILPTLTLYDFVNIHAIPGVVYAASFNILRW